MYFHFLTASWHALKRFVENEFFRRVVRLINWEMWDYRAQWMSYYRDCRPTRPYFSRTIGFALFIFSRNLIWHLLNHFTLSIRPSDGTNYLWWKAWWITLVHRTSMSIIYEIDFSETDGPLQNFETRWLKADKESLVKSPRSIEVKRCISIWWYYAGIVSSWAYFESRSQNGSVLRQTWDKIENKKRAFQFFM